MVKEVCFFGYTENDIKVPLTVKKLDGTSPTNVTWSKVVNSGNAGDLSLTSNGNKAVATLNNGDPWGYVIVTVGDYSFPVVIYID